MKQAIGARWGGVNGVASVIARIIEIVLWLGVAWLVVGAVLLYMNRSAIVVDADANRVYADSISVSGSFLDVDVYLGRGRMRDEVYYPLVALVLVAQLAILVCMALVFHEIADVCLRLKEWEHSRGGLEGPFGERMVRSFRFVGSCLIALPVVSWVMAAVCGLLGASVSVGLGSVVFVMLGLLCWSLAHVFESGAAMQHEMDGLV
ncbi:DUF2975 domain-containing protein [Bifidobacterium pullorum subsp. saeculare]|uniref:DUF2975 domain-containing protein n=1 Tax=Bifidobacterium pullorum TaxID=78448 RepID=UPI000529C84B|nr:DUF2975 domain-containing protein [Bifidobacterium pullorum]MBM6730202.1 DUF2975 domain-containing protein [Bifidobacterium pullorum subsp. saeculare]